MKKLRNFFTEEELHKVWKDSKYSKKGYRGLPGIDGETADQFRKSIHYNISNIIKSINNNDYKFSKLALKILDKPDGGKRILCIPTIRDRLVQRYILHYFANKKIPIFNSAVTYGFVAGKDWSLKAAHEKARELRGKHKWVFQTDIIKFFDCVQRNDIKDVIPKNIPKKLKLLIEAVISCELATGQADTLLQDNGIVRGRGLRQGMPISPFLTNLLLKKFDFYLTKKSIPAIRYADDITIFANSKEECENYLKIVKRMLKDLSLDIQDLADDEKCKTKIRTPTQTLDFLGVEIKEVDGYYKIYPPFKIIDKLNLKLSEISNFEYCKKNKLTFIDAAKKIDARVRGNIQAFNYVDKFDDFESEMKNLSKKHQANLLKSIIGEKAMKELSAEKMWALGLDT